MRGYNHRHSQQRAGSFCKGATVERIATDTRPPEADTPRQEYTQRLAARRREAECLARRYGWLSHMRALALTLIVLVAWLCEKEKKLPLLLLLPVLAFLAAMLWRKRISWAWQRTRQAIQFYSQRLDCLDGRWAGHGRTGARFLDHAHPCAEDLDLFGPGSLFELICCVRTSAGETVLAAWLRAAGTVEEICQRQAAVAELRLYLDLREELALLGDSLPEFVDLQPLADWSQAGPVPVARWAGPAAWGLVVLTLAALTSWLAHGAGPILFLGAVALEFTFAYWLRGAVRQILGPVERSVHELMLLAALLDRLEQVPFTSPLLVKLRRTLATEGLSASRALGRLSRLLHSLPFGPVAALLLLTTRVALALEAWRRTTGPALGRWVAAVGEFEALCALAAYAYDHPLDPFAELAPQGPCFEGEGLGHPLLPGDRCVLNDVRLDSQARLLVVTGSNMSGKSTLLRTVGVNAVLALAGAPVRAGHLRLSLLAIGATLRVQDSLPAGRSRFFAEILRLRQLVELTKSRPLLFLLDELLHGTNSHDRRQGAAAVVRSLLKRGAIGLITTHDLALTQLVEQFAPQAASVHFEDHMENDTLAFDYRMRPGMVQNSNALALMRSLGLEV
jgi:hypothetical protein